MKRAAIRGLAAALLALSLPAQSFTLGRLRFEPCDLPSRRAPVQAAQCANLEVPEDPAQPQGRQLALAVAVLPSRSARPAADPVVFLAGGPGQAAREAYPIVAAALEPLRDRRHIVLLDQRGTGGSNRLACPLPDWKDPAQASVAASRRQAQDCLAGLQGRADLRQYTTGNAVRDLETLRLALGVPAYNLVGGSYGTRVGLEYLRRHPQAVRSLVLDSVVHPQLALLQDHARNLDAALAKIFGRCQATPDCAARYGDPFATARRLMARPPVQVDFNDPVSFQPRREWFGREVLAGVLRLFSYAPESASLLPLMLDEADRGRPQALLAQAEMISRTLPDELAHGLELSVICAEDVPFLQPDPAEAQTLIGEQMTAMVRAQCELWPRGAVAADFKAPLQSDRPVLLLSGELDPVTPPANAEQARQGLSDSRHLIARGQGHIVSTRGCMPHLLRRFIDDPQPQKLDAACLDALGDTPAFLDYQGAAP